MLTVRIIPCLLFKERTIVKSLKFDDKLLRMVGDPTTVARVFNERNADELMFLDIMASRKEEGPNFPVLEKIANECFMPLAIGGGISTMEHVDKLFQIGADKVSINTIAFKRPEFITEISQKYGTQAVVVSIDVRKINGKFRIFTMGGKEDINIDLIKYAKKVESLGAGEILLNSIDRDGTTKGYDLDLIKMVSDEVTIPIIAAGGCGKLQDFVDAVKLGHATAICAATIFYYVGESIITIKRYMHEKGVNVRIT